MAPIASREMNQNEKMVCPVGSGLWTHCHLLGIAILRRGLGHWLFIRMVSRGPILFKQERVGYRGKRFMCLKFRTMHCGAETTPIRVICNN